MMKLTRLLGTAALLAGLSAASFNVYAATGAIKVTSIAETDVEVVKAGKKELKRMPLTKAVPGTEVILTTRFENVSDKTAPAAVNAIAFCVAKPNNAAPNNDATSLDTPLVFCCFMLFLLKKTT